MGVRILTPAEEQQERLRNLARTFEKVNRVLTNRNDVRCAVESNPQVNAPAWSDGRTVTFNLLHVGSITSIDDIIKITGLNYHELSHLLFTPRPTSWYGQKISEEGLEQWANILEDQRIETLLTGMYPATAPYFVATFMSYCLADPSMWERNHLLARGRHYLSRKVRDEFAARFKRQDVITDVNDIIDEYRLLAYPRDKERMLSLTEQLRDLFTVGELPKDPNGHADGRPETSKGSPVSGAEQEDSADWAEYFDEDNDENDSEDTESGTGSGKGDGENDSEESSGKGKGSKSDDDADDTDEGDDGDADSDDDSDRDGEGGGSGQSDDEGDSEDSQPGKGVGSGGGTPQMDDDKLAELMEKTVAAVVSRDDIVQDARDKQRSIIGGDGSYSETLPDSAWTEHDVAAQDLLISKRFAKELEQIRADLDPGFKTHQSSGRINIKRAMNGGDFDTVWDVWEPGHNDAADIEAVIYLDHSSSMAQQMFTASMAMWTIKSALESIDADVTVYGFNSASSVVYTRDEKVNRTKARIIGATGGTDPTQAIKESLGIFANSKRKTHLAIFVTDGEWGYRADDLIERMTQAGITTALCFLGETNYNGNTVRWDPVEGVVEEPAVAGPLPEARRHNCKIGEQVFDPSHLIPFARRIVTEVMKGQVS